MKRYPPRRFWAPVLLLGAAPIIIPVLGAAASGQTAQAATQPLLDKAHTLELSGRMDLAAQTWKQVLLTDSNNVEAIAGLARAAKLSNDAAGAAAYLDRLRSINPGDPNIARIERMSTQSASNAQLRQAARLAQQGQYAQAMTVYRQLYGDNPPPGAIALAYYETEAATENGRPHAVAALREMVANNPGDPRYEVVLGRILTYNPGTRPEGRKLLERHPEDPDSVEALRQSLLWDAKNPATAAEIRAYLSRHPDATLATVLENEPRARAMTASERAAAAVNATRTAEDRDAYRSLNAKQLQAAEAKFKAILARTPDDANALAGMGYIRMQQANFGGALSFLVQAKSDGSKDPGLEAALATSRFWYTMSEASSALNDNDLSGAEKDYRSALTLRPSSAEALEGLGGTLLKAEQPAAAAPIFAAYVKLKPSASHAWRGLFLAESQSGHVDRALETDRQLPAPVRAELSKDPLYLQALATAYTAAGRDGEAQSVLSRALDLPFPADASGVETSTRLQYAGLLLQANHPAQAAGLYRETLKKDSRNIEAYQGLIRVLHTSGHDPEAMETLDAMPPDVYSRAMLNGGFDQTVASIYQSQGRLDVAQDILEKTLQQETAQGEKPSVSVQTQLAGIYLQRDDPAQAYPLFQQVLGQHPENLDAWQGLIDALHSSGRDQEALAQVQQLPPAIRTQLEARVDFLQAVSGIYAGLGQPQESQVFLRRVLEHYASMHLAPPAAVDIQNAWLLYNGRNDAGLYRQLIELGRRTDLTGPQRRVVQTIWIDFALRRSSEAAAAGNNKLALAILNSVARTFADNPGVLKALAGGYAQAGMARQAVAIWKSMDLRTAPPDDYRSAIGAALAAQDQADAETWLRFALNQYPKDASLLILGAKFEEQRGDVNRAADYYHVAIQDMPRDDPAAALTTELSRPAQSGDVTLPGAMHGAADLATLLAPGASRGSINASQVPTQPYLPGSLEPGMVPMPYGVLQAPMPDSSILPPTAPSSEPMPARPAASSPGGRLRDYVPQAALDQRPPFGVANMPAQVAASSSQEVFDLLSPASFQHQQVLRLTQRAATASAPLTWEPSLPLVAISANELAQGATFRGAAFHPRQQSTQQATQATQQPVQQSAQPQTTGTNPDSTVYGPYVPYVPAGKKPANPQTTGQPQVPQPGIPKSGTVQPLTTQPAGSNSIDPTVDGVVYGPFVPYTPPPKTDVHLGSTPTQRQIAQPEVTDVLPTAKYSGASKPKPNTASRPDLAAARAAAERRRAAAAAESAKTGQSKPPAEDYATPPVEPAQYTTPVYAKPAPYPASTGQAGQNIPAQPTSPQGTETYGQQYPQPRSAGSPVHHARRPAPKVAAVPPTSAPAPVEEHLPSLSYPGVGTPLGSQPYPAIGRAFPLPPAPTDYDLLQQQLPPLRGSYEGVLPPQVPLTARQQAERDLAALEASYSGWLGGTGIARYRSGVVGYDRLTDLETTFEASYVAGNSVRFTVVPKAVFLNSGQLDVTNYTGVLGSPVIGSYNTATATANAAQQSANGIGGEFQIAAKNFAAAVGYTPYQFLVQNYTGRILFRPNSHFTLLANREPVTETQLSYAGLRDPGSATLFSAGNIWGGVISTGGGIRFDLGDEKAGFYLTADGANLTGYHVLDNTKFEGSMGAYFLAHTFPGYGRLNVGVSMFGMHYAHNERELSYGLGGYFSPNAYFLASVPITFTGRYGNNFHYTINGAVGVQSFTEDTQVFFPLDRGLETSFQTAQNCTIGQLTNHTCAQYPVNSNTGGNYSLNSEGAYRIADHWYAGGFLSGNNTNNYNTVTGGFFVRYTFRPQVSLDDTPTGLFPVEGFRPVRIP